MVIKKSSIIIILCFSFYILTQKGEAPKTEDTQKQNSRENEVKIVEKSEQQSKNTIKETVTIQTDDGWVLKGDLYKVNYDKELKLEGNAVLLLHMLPADRSSYNQLIPSLTELGLNVLNLDWRGHGESIYKKEKCLRGGGPTTAACPPPRVISYESFTNKDYKEAIKDVEAAIKFLEENGIKKENIGIIGASIGANYAIQYSAENPQLKYIILLSPGLDYHGVKIKESIETLAKSNVKIVIYSSSTDEDSYSYKSCQEIVTTYNKNTKATNLIVTYKEYVGHGTDMLKHIHDNLINNIKQILGK